MKKAPSSRRVDSPVTEGNLRTEKTPETEPGDGSISVSSTTLKNRLGEVLATALSGRPVYVTNREQPPRVVLLSVEKYDALLQQERRTLERLSHEFDQRLGAMHTSKSKAAVSSLFQASGGELGSTAVAAKRRMNSR